MTSSAARIRLRARDLLETLARRIQRAGQFAGLSDGLPDPHQIGRAADEVTVEHTLHWTDWQRWSSRHVRKCTLVD
jgi:hypothetical protein